MIKGTIEGLAFGGEGILRHEGMVVFVPFTVPGDQIECKIIKSKKNFAVGDLVKIHQPSSQRTIPLCPYFGVCGGCQLQHMTYQAQLEYKKKAVEDALKRIGGFSNATVEEIAPSKNPWEYRRHITLHLSQIQNSIQAGYIEIDNKTLLPVNVCPIFCSMEDLILIHLQKIVKKLDDSISGRVTLFKANPYLLVFNLNKSPKSSSQFAEEILLEYPEIQGILLKSPSEIISKGNLQISFTLDSYQFQASPTGFLQNNQEQSFNIYKTIQNLVKEGTVLDLYCGIGISSLLLAPQVREVIGVENNPDSIKLAKQNGKENGIHNATFINADVKKVVKNLFKEKNPSWVVMNPPREGLETKVVEAILENTPKNLLYVSCMPSTLARDLKIFKQAGYMIQKCKAFDMFPQTAHVETLVWLS